MSGNHLFGPEEALIPSLRILAHAPGIGRILREKNHGAPECIRIVGRNNDSGFAMDVDKRGARSDFARNHRLSEHRPLEQRYAKRLGSKVRREYKGETELDERDLVFIRNQSKKMDVGQIQPGRMFSQLLLHGTGADDDDRQSGALDRIEQDVQALVVSQYADKEKEAITEAPTPKSEEFS